MNDDLKAAVTVAEMARMVGMSRSRLYQLIGKAFPEPSRDENGRPYFDEVQQQTIFDVRRRNCGIDGKPILFYAPRNSIPPPISKCRPVSKPLPNSQHAGIHDGVEGLMRAQVCATQVDQAIKKLFPDGTDGVDPGEVIRAVFLSINGQNSVNKPKG